MLIEYLYRKSIGARGGGGGGRSSQEPSSACHVQPRRDECPPESWPDGAWQPTS